MDSDVSPVSESDVLEGSVSSIVAGGGGAHKGYGSTAATQRQLMERRTTGSARRVLKSDERWPAITSGRVAKETCRAISMGTQTLTKDIPTGDADRFGELVESQEGVKFQVWKNRGWLAGMTEDDVLERVNVAIGMGTQIPSTKDIPAIDADTFGDRFGKLVESCDGFAGIHPEHKFPIVQVLKNRGWLTGMTGVAVEGATGTAQGASAIVLTSAGLSIIVEAIDLARKIFQRMKNHMIYRIACTMQLLVFFCVDPQAVMGSTKDTADHDDIPRYF